MKCTHVILATVGLAACAPAGSGHELPSHASVPVTTRIEGVSSAYEVTTHTTDPSARHVVDVAPDLAWKLVPLVYAELELPGAVLDPRGRMFGFERERMRRKVGDAPLTKIVNCGTGVTGPNALTYVVTLDVVTLVSPVAAGSSAIETRVQGFAKPRSVSGNPVRCATTGALELYIAERIRALAAKV
ncbi:MAG TPA: hypothetical protein VF212_06500 [Longimicrobiales bacterium]